MNIAIRTRRELMSIWQDLEKKYYMQVVRRQPVTIVKGLGTKVWDDENKEYLDFTSGWAVNNLGHCHPAIVEAIKNQAETLMQTSNQFFTVPQVQLAQDAINRAKEQGLVLIEIPPNAKPPVCKIMDMGKYKYDAQKKANKAKKKQKKIELKEIKLRPVTEVHDYTFKIKNAQKFIAKGDKVKFTIRFKGRELQHSSLGNELMDKIKQDMETVGRVELQPKFDGKQMIMVIQPL